MGSIGFAGLSNGSSRGNWICGKTWILKNFRLIDFLCSKWRWNVRLEVPSIVDSYTSLLLRTILAWSMYQIMEVRNQMILSQFRVLSSLLVNARIRMNTERQWSLSSIRASGGLLNSQKENTGNRTDCYLRGVLGLRDFFWGATYER